jgi:cysteine desulfurase
MTLYADWNATHPLRPEAASAMAAWAGIPANPSSVHASGRAARRALEEARARIAGHLGVATDGVVFTSGATEANAAALHGLWAQGHRHVIASPHEHASLRDVLEAWQARGGRVTWMPVDPLGRAQPEASDADVAVLLAAQHETGVVQPVDRLLRAAPRAWRHVDATQALAWGALPEADSLAISAHKVGGPVGIGALVFPGGGRGFPALFGGSQERGRRAGTTPVALAVGFAAALDACRTGLADAVPRVLAARAAIEAAVLDLGGTVHGRGAERLPNTVAASFAGLSGEALVASLDLRGVAASAGAACASGASEPSPALVAMGWTEPRGLLRLSLGHDIDDRAVATLRAALCDAVAQARQAEAWAWDGDANAGR